ncbi:MAG: MotA/TolQ/ExbB proton channel family protein [Chitinophagales bacterium]|nr:MotA/TolQ/ExbB proton channel family protein [Chitinophagales bacterium]MDW8393459.1 MotA/TolQ/ExbB proton channel family protein [Chitinophagales bacterium]
MTLLLQITQAAVDSLTLSSNVFQNTAPAQDSLSLLSLLVKGGWIMIPIGIFSILAVYFSIERYIVISRASRIDRHFMLTLRDQLLNGKMESALALCRSTNSPFARLLLKGIKRIGRPIKEVESAVENEGRLEIYKLERNLQYLSIIAGVAPMMGFVGTISGVIRIFYNISVEANISIDAIAGGLYEKMITSAAGLIVGIFAFIMHQVLNSMIDRVSYTLEQTAVDFVDLIQEPAA